MLFTEMLDPSRALLMFILSIAVIVHVAKKIFAASPAVKVGAKKYAARGAIHLLSKMFKR